MEFFAIHEAQPATGALCRKLFDNNLIVLPSVSYGNVGQLAMDLLVNTLLCKAKASQEEFALVGHLFSPRVAPFAGSCAYSVPSTRDDNTTTSCSSTSSPLTLNLEVFQLKSRRLTFIQQRTDVFPHQARAFAQELAEWAARSGAKGFCVLTGADDMLRHEEPHAATALNLQTIALQPVEGCNWQLVDQLPACQENWNKELRGIGLTSLLFNCCQQQQHPPLAFVAFVLFCAEGNNVPEAMQLAVVMVEFLRLWDIVDKDQQQLQQTNDQTNVQRGVLKATGGSPSQQPVLQQKAAQTLVIPRSWAQLFGKKSDVSLFW